MTKTRFWSCWALLLLAVMPIIAQDNAYTLRKYDGSVDFGILDGLTGNGKWGIIQNGSSAAGGFAHSQLFNTETGLAEERGTMGFLDVSDDGNITVGSRSGKPAAYNHLTGKITTFPIRKGYVGGFLIKVTPDGKYGVGKYTTSDEMEYAEVLVDIEKGDTIYTPGLPKKDMTHLNQKQNQFIDITPDGRYVVGMMSDCYLSPASLFTYVYDTETHTYDVVGFVPNDLKPWVPLYPNTYFVDAPVLSPDGHYMTGYVYIVEPVSGDMFGPEYRLPFRYDLLTKEYVVYDDADSRGKRGFAIDNEGTIFAAIEGATPLRDFSVFYKQKYWISFATICQQIYGFDFFRRTGYENTGTPTGVSGDGTSFTSFPDPQGESYWFHFGRPVEEICAETDLLGTYSVTPVEGAEFAKVPTLSVTFDRAIQVLGEYDNVRILDSKGNLFANPTSSGVRVNSENHHEVLLQFRNKTFAAGENYTVVIDAGTVCVAGDPTMTNKEIRFSYTGREDQPVKVVSVLPAEGSELASIDDNSQVITLTFDSKIKVNATVNATLRKKDGTVLAYLNAYYGDKYVTLFPTGTHYLYAGQEYEVVVNAGSVTDLTDSESSANEEIRIAYKGIYERPIPTDGVVFSEDFNDMSSSLNTWLRYEGDHLTPSQEMAAWGFDKDNQPWNFSVRDDGSADICAASHSMYATAGTSVDLMMTPQIQLPNDDRIKLTFDAQSYLQSKRDNLVVFVWESDEELNVISAETFATISNEMQEVFSERLSPGSKEEELKDDWTHYTVDLGKWKNKNVYIGFFNNNRNQSVIFVDNIKVARDMFYKMQFSNEETVVAENDVTLKGKFGVSIKDAEGDATLCLKDAAGVVISTVELKDCKVDNMQEFEFAPMPLTIGTENHYSVEVKAGKMEDEYKGAITDLAFRTTKRVALEEMTGQGCPNCPLGILTIEKLRAMYGKQIVPISIHTYTGDQLGAGLYDYSGFLGLGSAPSARIDRVEGVYYPMWSSPGYIYQDSYNDELWLDVVRRQMNKLAPANIELGVKADDSQNVTLTTAVRFALDYNSKLYNLAYIFMEDDILGYQDSNLSNVPKQEVLGDWCQGGAYARERIQPFMHEDVVRQVAESRYAGITGLIPSAIEAGVKYTVTRSYAVPQNVLDLNKMHVAVLLIDVATGAVVNCADARVGEDVDGIHTNSVTGKDADAYNINGQRVGENFGGIRIVSGKKMVIRK